jgi:hypothetical protein
MSRLNTETFLPFKKLIKGLNLKSVAEFICECVQGNVLSADWLLNHLPCTYNTLASQPLSLHLQYIGFSTTFVALTTHWLLNHLPYAYSTLASQPPSLHLQYAGFSTTFVALTTHRLLNHLPYTYNTLASQPPSLHLQHTGFSTTFTLTIHWLLNHLRCTYNTLASQPPSLHLQYTDFSTTFLALTTHWLLNHLPYAYNTLNIKSVRVLKWTISTRSAIRQSMNSNPIPLQHKALQNKVSLTLCYRHNRHLVQSVLEYFHVHDVHKCFKDLLLCVLTVQWSSRSRHRKRVTNSRGRVRVIKPRSARLPEHVARME